MAPNVKFKGKGSNLVAYIKERFIFTIKKREERFMLFERYVPTHNCCMLHDILSMQIAVNCTILRNAKLSRKLSGLQLANQFLMICPASSMSVGSKAPGINLDIYG